MRKNISKKVGEDCVIEGKFDETDKGLKFKVKLKGKGCSKLVENGQFNPGMIGE